MPEGYLFFPLFLSGTRSRKAVSAQPGGLCCVTAIVRLLQDGRRCSALDVRKRLRVGVAASSA